MFKENYWASMETDILGISSGAVWRHASTTVSAVKRKQTPPTEARNAHRPNLDGDILFSDLTNKTTTYSR